MEYSGQEKELQTLETIRRVGSIIATEGNFDTVAHEILIEVSRQLGSACSMFCRPSSSASAPVQVVAEYVEAAQGDSASASAQLLPLLHRHAGVQTPFKVDNDSAASELHSYLQVPLASAQGTYLGTFCFGHSNAEYFSDSDVRFVDSLTPWLAAAIERSQADSSSSTSDDWIATVSHDLRNPLQRMCMVSEILSEFVEGSQRELVAKLIRATDSMEKLIEDLVDVVAIENKRLHLERFEMRLDNSLESVCEAKRADADAKQVTLRCEGDNASAPMIMDTRRMEQALGILIDRAIEATPAGCLVEVRSEQSEGAGVRIEIRDQRDAGGEEGLGKLVERLHPPRRGTGQKPDLGLNIARGIIEAHGGTLSLRLGDAAGITWSLDWPAPR